MKFPIAQSFLIFILGCFSLTYVSAQTPITEAVRTAEVTPQWPGCPVEMKECTRARLDAFIAANVQTPPEAKAKNVGGVVLVEFVVEKNGTIGEVRTLHDPGLGLGVEAIRVVTMMKDQKIKWSPAEDKGKRVPFRFMTPVSFNLEKPAEPIAEKPVKELDMPEIYDVAEVMPRYSGCQVSETDTIDCTFMQLINHIRTNLVYPDSAIAVGAQGPVVVQFIIDATGNVTNPTITKSVGYGCDEEALRVISLMPAWQPGMQDGKPVAVRMVVPVMFQISKPEKE